MTNFSAMIHEWHISDHETMITIFSVFGEHIILCTMFFSACYMLLLMRRGPN